MNYEQEAQRAAEERLAACNEHFWAEESGEQPPEGPYPACGPYDACDTCIVREVLDAAWPYLLRLAREEVACS
jgi:hypothetical protein